MTAGEVKTDREGGRQAPSAEGASAAVAALHLRHAEELRYFILGVVRDHDVAADVVQAAFAKAVELGHTVKQESLKAWLFRVAYNEALALRRRQAVGERVMRLLAERPRRDEVGAEGGLVRGETVQAVRAAMNELPPEQRQVVAMRIYEHKKFIEISQELGLPLGTVLSRMQLALGKLRRSLAPQVSESDS